MCRATGLCGMYGTNGKSNVTNGPNGLYRLSGQREWGINWRNECCYFTSDISLVTMKKC